MCREIESRWPFARWNLHRVNKTSVAWRPYQQSKMGTSSKKQCQLAKNATSSCFMAVPHHRS